MFFKNRFFQLFHKKYECHSYSTMFERDLIQPTNNALIKMLPSNKAKPYPQIRGIITYYLRVHLIFF